MTAFLASILPEAPISAFLLGIAVAVAAMAGLAVCFLRIMLFGANDEDLTPYEDGWPFVPPAAPAAPHKAPEK